jgi:hypothetical protein
MDNWTGEPDFVLGAQAPGGRTARNGHRACSLWADAVHGAQNWGPSLPCSTTRSTGGFAFTMWIMALVRARELPDYRSGWTTVHAGGIEGRDEVGRFFLPKTVSSPPLALLLQALLLRPGPGSSGSL